MKRSSCSEGNRGTRSGSVFDGAMPLHAIWSVVQTGFEPAAATILRVRSPTSPAPPPRRPAWTPGGYESG
jgi:hypothetical protein